ncbi:hypothetical protein [Polaromonas sp.]|uniref:hypothetical protein n=1 Tax=Polaromonas sp. TaxID=1869339 RepID=UPI003752697D
MTSPFAWRGQPSATGKALGRTQTAPKTPPKPITYSSKPAHGLRPAEAQRIHSKSRAPTTSINTEPARIVRTKGAAI